MQADEEEQKILMPPGLSRLLRAHPSVHNSLWFAGSSPLEAGHQLGWNHKSRRYLSAEPKHPAA